MVWTEPVNLADGCYRNDLQADRTGQLQRHRPHNGLVHPGHKYQQPR